MHAASKLAFKIGHLCIDEKLGPKETILALVHASVGLLESGLKLTPEQSHAFIRRVLNEHEKVFVEANIGNPNN